MEDYQIRVGKELDALRDNMGRLRAFLFKGQPQNVSNRQWMLMGIQVDAMGLLANVLQQRYNDFEPPGQYRIDADKLYKGDEVHELLDLVQADGTIHDLDKYEVDSMQTTLGQTLCGVLKRLEELEKQVGNG